MRVGFLLLAALFAVGCGDDDGSQDNGGPGRVVFATSTTQDADLGGFDGADALCNQLASAAGLSGPFKAWLSSVSESTVDRMSHSDIPYRRVDGRLVADNWDDLLDGSLAAPINLDENGNMVAGDVWTGTLADGSPWPDDDCSGFTASDGSQHAACGNSTALDSSWTDHLRPACPTSLRLYCFEQ